MRWGIAHRCCWMLLGLAWPLWGRAEPPIHIDFGIPHFAHDTIFGIAALLSLPTASATLLAEALAPRRRVPLWLSTLAGLAAALVAALALSSKPGHDREWFVFLWFAVPPLAVLTLRGALPYPPLRLGVGTVVAVAAFLLAGHIDPDKEKAAALLGGATVCLLLWSITVLVLWSKGAWPEAVAEPVRSARSELRGGVSAATQRMYDAGNPLLNRIERLLQPAETGLTWWLGAALALYFGIGAAVAHDKLGGGMWIYAEVQQCIDLFGLPPLRIAQTKQLWWLVGLPWSLIVGSAVWGLAGMVGAFNPGRARLARLAAIVFGGALLAWSVMLVMQTEEIRAREEEQVMGVRR